MAQSVVEAGLSGPSCPDSVLPAVGGCTCGSAPESRAAAAAAVAPPSGVDEVFERSVLDLGIAGWGNYPSLELVTSCDVEVSHCVVELSARTEHCT